jgi:hypothetical protein
VEYLKDIAMDKLIHGTIEATVFNATPYSPSFPFNVSSNELLRLNIL